MSQAAIVGRMIATLIGLLSTPRANRKEALPPSVFGFPEKSEVPETNFDDWLAGLIRPRPRQ